MALNQGRQGYSPRPRAARTTVSGGRQVTPHRADDGVGDRESAHVLGPLDMPNVISR